MFIYGILVLFVTAVVPGLTSVNAQDVADTATLQSQAVLHANLSTTQRAPQSAEPSDRQQLQRSRDIVEKGLSVAMDGSLRKMGDRWFLAAEHTLHELLFGLESYVQETGIALESGKQVRLTGFYHAPDDDPAGVIVVNTVIMDGETYRFREDDGSPLWRGRGRGTGTGSRERNP